MVFGTLTTEGKIDSNAPVARYLPEIENSGFGDATVAQVPDMTSGLQYVEDYADPKSNWHDLQAGDAVFSASGGVCRTDECVQSVPHLHVHIVPRYAYLATIPKLGEHRPAFKYRSINTNVLAWIMARVTGKTPAELLEERLWVPLGMEDDAVMAVGPGGIQFVAGGLNCRLRDLARFGDYALEWSI